MFGERVDIRDVKFSISLWIFNDDADDDDDDGGGGDDGGDDDDDDLTFFRFIKKQWMDLQSRLRTPSCTSLVLVCALRGVPRKWWVGQADT